MLLWVIIKTTDNGAKCLLTGLAIILCNQDRWEHYKLQINPFNNEGPRCARPVASIVARAARARAVLQQVLCELWLLDETLHERETRFDFEQNKRKNNSRSRRAAGPPSRLNAPRRSAVFIRPRVLSENTPIQPVWQGLMTALHLHTCLQLSPVLIQVMIVLLTPSSFSNCY